MIYTITLDDTPARAAKQSMNWLSNAIVNLSLDVSVTQKSLHPRAQGAMEALEIIVPASATVLGIVGGVVKEWLRRHHGISITITVEDGKKRIEAKNLKSKDLQELLPKMFPCEENKPKV